MTIKQAKALGAQMHCPDDTSGLYRWAATVYNDGTVGHGLSYYSHNFNTWRGSNERDHEKFAKTLTLLPGLKPYDFEKAAVEALEADRIKLDSMGAYESVAAARRENYKKNHDHYPEGTEKETHA